MMGGNHTTEPVQVWADIDVEIASAVRFLNTIPGVRTHTSCQGNVGEGRPFTYEPYVTVSWATDEARATILASFGLEIEGDHHGRAHPVKGQLYGADVVQLADNEICSCSHTVSQHPNNGACSQCGCDSLLVEFVG
jgi:hypothetical protein